MMPQRTSRSPSDASGAATRRWQASASCSPPPRAAPRIAATVGTGRSSNPVKACCSQAMSGAATSPPASWPNNATSRPAENARPSPTTSTARQRPAATASAAASAAACRPAKSPSSMAFNLSARHSRTSPTSSSPISNRTRPFIGQGCYRPRRAGCVFGPHCPQPHPAPAPPRSPWSARRRGGSVEQGAAAGRAEPGAFPDRIVRNRTQPQPPAEAAERAAEGWVSRAGRRG
jgi:hypothetical protein